jgi:hypothetical protein
MVLAILSGYPSGNAGIHRMQSNSGSESLGPLPYLTEFDGRGAVVFSAEFPAGVNTYRAYRFPWR